MKNLLKNTEIMKYHRSKCEEPAQIVWVLCRRISASDSKGKSLPSCKRLVYRYDAHTCDNKTLHSMAPDHGIEEREELHCAPQLSLKPPHTCSNLLSNELNCLGCLVSGNFVWDAA